MRKRKSQIVLAGSFWFGKQCGLHSELCFSFEGFTVSIYCSLYAEIIFPLLRSKLTTFIMLTFQNQSSFLNYLLWNFFFLFPAATSLELSPGMLIQICNYIRINYVMTFWNLKKIGGCVTYSKTITHHLPWGSSHSSTDLPAPT